MKPRGDWYFEGYEGRSVPNASGRPRRELVYTGEYYGFAREQNRLLIKTFVSLACIVYLLCYTLNALSVCDLARTGYVGIPMMLSMVPAVYLLMGAVCLWPQGEEMTVRGLYSSLRRIQRALLILVPLLAICVGGGVARFCVEPVLLQSKDDIGYFVCAVVSFSAVTFMFVLLRKNPVVVVRDPQPGSIREKEMKEKNKHRK